MASEDADSFISIDLVQRAVVYRNLKSAAKRAVRDQYPGTLKYKFYDWIVNYCRDPNRDKYLVKIPDFSLTLASLMALHTRVILGRRTSKVKISQWRVLLREVLGDEAPKEHLKTISETLSGVCEAITELLVSYHEQIRAQTTIELTRACGEIMDLPIPRTRTATAKVQDLDPLPMRSMQVPLGGEKFHDLPVSKTKDRPLVSKTIKFPRREPELTQEEVQDIPEERTPPRAKVHPQLHSSTICPSSGAILLSGITYDQEPPVHFEVPIRNRMPEPPDDWQISADDDSLVQYQQSCKPTLSLGRPPADQPAIIANPPSQELCPMSLPWELAFLDN